MAGLDRAERGLRTMEDRRVGSETWPICRPNWLFSRSYIGAKWSIKQRGGGAGPLSHVTSESESDRVDVDVRVTASQMGILIKES